MGAKANQATPGFSPGPWTVDLPWALKNGGHYIVMSENDPVANCGPDGAANARLIAAAPDLLLACRDALSALNYLLGNEQAGHRLDPTSGLPIPIDGCMCARCTLARAIAKAEGKEVAP